MRGDPSPLHPAVLRRGVAAGLAGTLARMAVERAGRAIGRPPRATPGLVAVRLLGIDAPAPGARALLRVAVHWGHGAGAGVVRALLAAREMRGAGVSALHCLVMWGGDAAVLCALGIAPPPWRWPAGDLVADVADKAAFTTVAGVVADTLTARGSLAGMCSAAPAPARPRGRGHRGRRAARAGMHRGRGGA